MEHPSYFNNRACGVIRGDPQTVYNSCNKKYVIVRDIVEERSSKTLNDFFDALLKMQTTVTMFGSMVLDTNSVLSYFLKIHKEFKKQSDTNHDFVKNYSFTEVIFVEVSSHLSAEAEYLLLMYKYLLYQRIYMPQLFVIIDYPTTVLDFIDREILISPMVAWNPRRHNASNAPLAYQPSAVQLEPHLLNIGSAVEKLSDSGITCVLISMNNFYENKLKEATKELSLVIHEDLESFDNAPKNANVRTSNIILLDTPEKLLSYTGTALKPRLIIFDTRVKIGINQLYAGNVPMPVLPNIDYVKGIIWKFLQRFGDVEVRIYNEGKDRVVRGIFVRSPITDYIRFEMHGVNMVLLYSNYYEGLESRNFISIIRSEAEVLRDFGYEENREKFFKAVILNVHPMVISLIESWFEKKLPRVCILVFAAVMLTYDKMTLEVKEHGTREHENDVSQTSRYGQILYEYLKLMETHRSVIMEEGGKTSRLLKRFLDVYKIEEEEMLLFNHNAFTTQLVKLIHEKYPRFILHQQGASKYRGGHNTQMNWKVFQTTNTPQQLFPFTVTTNSSYRSIILFIPLDRM